MPTPSYLQKDADRLSGETGVHSASLLGGEEHEEVDDELFHDALDHFSLVDDESDLDAPEPSEQGRTPNGENEAVTRILSRLIYHVALRITGLLLARFANVVGFYRQLEQIYDDTDLSSGERLIRISEVVKSNVHIFPERLRNIARTGASHLKMAGEILDEYNRIKEFYRILKDVYDDQQLPVAQKLSRIVDLLEAENDLLPENLQPVTSIASALRDVCSLLRPAASDNDASALTRIREAMDRIGMIVDSPLARSILPEGAASRTHSSLQPVRLILDQVDALASLPADSGFADYLTALVDMSGADSRLSDMLRTLLPLTELIGSRLPDLNATYPTSGAVGEQLGWLMSVLADESLTSELLPLLGGESATSIAEGLKLAQHAKTTFSADASVGQQAAWMVQQMNLPSTQRLFEQSGFQPVIDTLKRQLGIDPSSIDLMHVLLQVTDARQSAWQKALSIISPLISPARLKHALRPALAQAVSPVLGLLPGGNLFSSAWEWYQRVPPGQDWSTTLRQFADIAWEDINRNPLLITAGLPGGHYLQQAMNVVPPLMRFPRGKSWEQVLEWAVQEAKQNPATQWYYNRYVELCLGWAIYQALRLTNPVEQERKLRSVAETLTQIVAPLGLPGMETVINLLPLLPALLEVRQSIAGMPETDSWIAWANELIGVLEQSPNPAWQKVREQLQARLEQVVSDALVSGLDSLPMIGAAIYARLPAFKDPLTFAAADAATIPAEYVEARRKYEKQLAASFDEESTTEKSSAEASSTGESTTEESTTEPPLTASTADGTLGAENLPEELIDDFLIELLPEDLAFLEKKTPRRSPDIGAVVAGISVGAWWLATMYAVYRAVRPARDSDNPPTAENIELIVSDHVPGPGRESIAPTGPGNTEADKLVLSDERVLAGKDETSTATTSIGARLPPEPGRLKKYGTPLIMAAMGALATTLYGYLLLQDDTTPMDPDITPEEIKTLLAKPLDTAESTPSEGANELRMRRRRSVRSADPVDYVSPALKKSIKTNWQQYAEPGGFSNEYSLIERNIYSRKADRWKYFKIDESIYKFSDDNVALTGKAILWNLGYPPKGFAILLRNNTWDLPENKVSNTLESYIFQKWGSPGRENPDSNISSMASDYSYKGNDGFRYLKILGTFWRFKLCPGRDTAILENPHTFAEMKIVFQDGEWQIDEANRPKPGVETPKTTTSKPFQAPPASVKSEPASAGDTPQSPAVAPVAPTPQRGVGVSSSLQTWISENWKKEDASNPSLVYTMQDNGLYKSESGAQFIKAGDSFWPVVLQGNKSSGFIENRKTRDHKYILLADGEWRLSSHLQSDMHPNLQNVIQSLFDYDTYSSEFVDELKTHIKQIFDERGILSYSELLSSLHKILDLWFEKEHQVKTSGEVEVLDPEKVKDIIKAKIEVSLKLMHVKGAGGVSNIPGRHGSILDSFNTPQARSILREYREALSVQQVNAEKFYDTSSPRGRYEEIGVIRKNLKDSIDYLRTTLSQVSGQINASKLTRDAAHSIVESYRRGGLDPFDEKNDDILAPPYRGFSMNQPEIYQEKTAKREKLKNSRKRYFDAISKIQKLSNDLTRHTASKSHLETQLSEYDSGVSKEERLLKTYKDGIALARRKISDSYLTKPFDINEQMQELHSDIKHNSILIDLAWNKLEIMNQADKRTSSQSHSDKSVKPDDSAKYYNQNERDQLLKLNVAMKYVSESKELTRIYLKSLAHVDFDALDKIQKKGNYLDIIVAQEQAVKIYLKMIGSPLNLSPQETIYKRYQTLATSSSTVEGKLVLIAAFVYTYITAPVKDGSWKNLSVENLISKFSSDQYSLALENQPPKKPENFKSIIELKPSKDFEYQLDFTNQFKDYTEKYSAYEASRLAMQFSISANLDIGQLQRKVKYLRRFRFLNKNYTPPEAGVQPIQTSQRLPGELAFMQLEDDSWVVVHFSPEFIFIKNLKKSEMEGNSYLKEIMNNTQYTQKKGSEFWINIFEKLRERPHKKDRDRRDWDKMRTEFIGPVLGKNNEYFKRINRQLILQYNASEAPYIPTKNAISEIEAFMKSNLDRLALLLKDALAEQSAWQRFAMAFMPFYAEIYKYLTDELHEPDVIGILFDVASLGFVATSVGVALAKPALKQLAVSLQINRNAGLHGKQLLSAALKDLAKTKLLPAREVSKILASGLYDLLEPLPMKDALSAVVSSANSPKLSALANLNFNASSPIGLEGLSSAWGYKDSILYGITPGTLNDKFQGIYQVFDTSSSDAQSVRSFVKDEKYAFEVTWNEASQTWQVLDPDDSNNPASAVPIKLENNKWVTRSTLPRSGE